MTFFGFACCCQLCSPFVVAGGLTLLLVICFLCCSWSYYYLWYIYISYPLWYCFVLLHGFLHDVVSGCFCCSLLLACDLLSNLPGQKRTDNGSDIKANQSWKMKWTYPGMKYTLVNHRGSNCAKRNAEIIFPGGHCESGFPACSWSWTTQHTKVKPKCRKITWKHWVCLKPAKMRARYSQMKEKTARSQNCKTWWQNGEKQW